MENLKMNKQYILFDLDGTLTNPAAGITRCVQYALRAFDIEEPDLDRLTCYIGPPLDESFRRFHGLSQKEAVRAVAKYRERFSEIGIFENEVIEGIVPCLDALRRAGKTLALATCKPEVFALRILEHFGLSGYFTVSVGSGLDGARKYKHEVIEAVFNRLEPDRTKHSGMKAAAVMVGDRSQDIEGAGTAGIESVGVRFGYAAPGELEEAGADYIADTVPQLEKLLLGVYPFSPKR